MRKLAAFALAFSGAVFSSCLLFPLHWLLPLAAACALGAAGFLLARGDVRRRGVLLLLGAALGFSWYWGWTALRLAPVDELADRSARSSAVVLDFPARTDYGVRVEVRLLEGLGVRTLLYTSEDYLGLEPGDRIGFTADFQSASFRHGEATSYYTSKGIFLIASAREELTVLRPAAPPLWALPVRCARALRESIAAVFPADASGLAAAVILGDRDALEPGDSTALSRAGLSHAVSVSGMHVAFLSSALLLLLRGRHRTAAKLAIPLLFLFALIAGAGPSVMRAAVMQSLLLLAPALGREQDPPTSLSFALMLLLLHDPYAAAGIGLQLSFAAAAGILLVSGPLLRRLAPLLPRRGRAPLRRPARAVCRTACGVFSVTVGALLSTAPLTALYFRSVSLAAVLSGLLTMWAVTGLFVLGLPAALIGLLSRTAGAAAALLPALCARWVLWVARGLGGLDFAALPLDSPYLRLWLGGTCLLVLAFALLRRERPRPVLPLCGAALMLCAALCFSRGTYAAAPLSVSVLDVGQGSSTALISQGRAVLVDCGGSVAGGAGDVAADRLQSLGISRLDLLVLTHFDSDHVGGVEDLLRRVEVSAVAFPDTEAAQALGADLLARLRAAGAEVLPISRLSGARLGEARLTIYPPLGSGSSNETGLMVLCSAGDYDVLITGDADASTEAMLIKYFPVPDIELLVVGHHGSARSTSAPFLAAVAPEAAVISTGWNRYGHPAPQTLERLSAAGAEVYRTDRHGTVTAVVHP